MGDNWFGGERRAARARGRFGQALPGGPWPRSGASDVGEALRFLAAGERRMEAAAWERARVRLTADPRPARELARSLGLAEGRAAARMAKPRGELPRWTPAASVAAGPLATVAAGPLADVAARPCVVLVLAHWSIPPAALLACVQGASARGLAALVLGDGRAPAALDALGETLCAEPCAAPFALLHGAGVEALSAALQSGAVAEVHGLLDGRAGPLGERLAPRLRRARLRPGADPGRAATLALGAAFGSARALGGQAHGALGFLEVPDREHAAFVSAHLARLAARRGPAPPRALEPALWAARERRIETALGEGGVLVFGSPGGALGGRSAARPMEPAVVLQVPARGRAALAHEPLGVLLLARGGRA